MHSLLKLLAKLPLSVLYVLAFIVAFISMRLPNHGIRRMVRINLWLAYPNLDAQARQQLEWASLYSQSMTAVESLKSWGEPAEFSLGQIQQVEGQNVLLEALQNGKGTILVIPHLGTWEIMNPWFSQFASPVIMYKPSKTAAIDQFMLTARQRQHATLVPTDESGVRAIFKALKQGGVTAILPDHVPDHAGGIYSPFFGHEVLTTTLVSKLAAKTQCNIIGLSCLRLPTQQGFKVICERLSEHINDRDLQTSVDTLNLEIQRMISRAPEQYVWAYRRYKRAKDSQLNNIYRMDMKQISPK